MNHTFCSIFQSPVIPRTPPSRHTLIADGPNPSVFWKCSQCHCYFYFLGDNMFICKQSGIRVSHGVAPRPATSAHLKVPNPPQTYYISNPREKTQRPGLTRCCMSYKKCYFCFKSTELVFWFLLVSSLENHSPASDHMNIYLYFIISLFAS